ncbi:30S ribosomal protein S6 [Calidithermus timidus]|jgi:small subunit ribosomal protein S6|uniref:30S ribosomal protein S6 n=1 Tax=Calidithermus timidus TaxID=307124 RepID=UPI000361A4C7|nr:30S ribosomal protein S6 [Calidithermus timidus]
MPQYDLNLVLNPNLDAAQVAVEKEFIQQALARYGATVKATDEWGQRRMAYPIQKDPEGYVIFYTLEMEGANAQPLEKELRLRDNVRRVLIIRDRPEWRK